MPLFFWGGDICLFLFYFKKLMSHPAIKYYACVLKHLFSNHILTCGKVPSFDVQFIRNV